MVMICSSLLSCGFLVPNKNSYFSVLRKPVGKKGEKVIFFRMTALENFMRFAAGLSDEERKTLIPLLQPAAAAAPPPSDQLAKEFLKSRQLTQQPWRSDFDVNETYTKTTLDKEWDAIQEDFKEQAKEKRFTAEEIMTMTYVMFAEDAGRKYYACCVNRYAGFERIKHHNLYVAKNIGDHWIDANGKDVVTLPWPLFPPHEKFVQLNEQIMRVWREYQENPTAAGPRPSAPPTSLPYKRPELAEQPTAAVATRVRSASAIRGGDSTLQIVQDSQGAYVVDATPVEGAVCELQRRVFNLEKLNAQLTRQAARGRGQAMIAAPTQGRGGGVYRSRGGRGGRGGRGWVRGGGDDDEEGTYADFQ
jgi:hypothetical protein